MDRNKSEKENHYFPLRLRSKFAHKIHGFVPSKKHARWQKWFLSNPDQTNATKNDSFYKILFEMYVNMKEVRNSDIGTRPDMMRCFRKIIPKEYYGSFYNRRQLFLIIKRIITQTQYHYIHISALGTNFRYEDILWLNMEQNCMEQMVQANILVIQTVVKPLIRSYYYYLASYKDNSFSVVPKGQGDAFFDRSINTMCEKGHIRLVDPTESAAAKPIGKLRVFPKFGYDRSEYRPILQPNKNQVDDSPVDIKLIKLKLKRMVKKYKTKTMGGPLKFFDDWIDFFQKTKNRAKLYAKDKKQNKQGMNFRVRVLQVKVAIKLDLFDAFGFIEIEKLKQLIIRPTEEGLLFNHEVDYLLDLVSNQYVTIRGQKQLYKWRHGLLQGMHLAPLLCELYLSHDMFERFKGIEMADCFFRRAVDDILFVTPYQQKMREFQQHLFRREIILNHDKTQRYEDKTDDPRLLFSGKLFNLETRETCTSHNYKNVKALTFRLFNPQNQFTDKEGYRILKKAMQYSPFNHYFSEFDLNTVCNSFDTVVKNIFNGMCYVAIKLICTVETIQYIFADQEDCCQDVIKTINYIQRLYPMYIERTVEKSKGEYYINILSVKLFKFLCFKAFYQIFKKKSITYKNVVTHLKQKLKGFYIRDLKFNTDIHYISQIPKAFRNIKYGR